MDKNKIQKILEMGKSYLDGKIEDKENLLMDILEYYEEFYTDIKSIFPENTKIIIFQRGLYKPGKEKRLINECAIVFNYIHNQIRLHEIADTNIMLPYKIHDIVKKFINQIDVKSIYETRNLSLTNKIKSINEEKEKTGDEMVIDKQMQDAIDTIKIFVDAYKNTFQEEA